jgi:hypothetical protein
MTDKQRRARNLTGHIAIPFEIAFAPTRSESDSVSRHSAALCHEHIEPHITSGCTAYYGSPGLGLGGALWRGLADVK